MNMVGTVEMLGTWWYERSICIAVLGSRLDRLAGTGPDDGGSLCKSYNSFCNCLQQVLGKGLVGNLTHTNPSSIPHRLPICICLTALDDS
jgi:hypothetical protein